MIYITTAQNLYQFYTLWLWVVERVALDSAVKHTGQEKHEKAQILSTNYQATYTFTSTKQSATKVSVRQQLYAQSVSVDGGAMQNGQVNLTRQVAVPAGGKVSLTCKVKVVN